MKRVTVDFGIDLGTTNSAIAVLKGTDVEVIRNNEGFEYTPSAVFIDRNGGLTVGRRAKERLDIDAENAKSEFKLQMGTDAEYVFARTGRRMRPEELSAEVLKSLLADVKQRTGEEVQSAVITVPVAFELPQCKATNDAAKLAGISFSPLVQEPVAAAMAYGFQRESNRACWLVYDLGGGTFDAAVIKMRDGIIRVVNHGGDNHVGGKLIDWAIVDQLLVPAVARQFQLSDFRRGNPKWSKAIAKLKLRAEEAKIRAAHDATVEILIDPLAQDESGKNLTFECELAGADIARVAEPFIAHSIRICHQVLADAQLSAAQVERVLTVGETTMLPFVRERLSDPHRGLGIPLDFSQDPLTAVVRGAAIFAGSQRLVTPSIPGKIARGNLANTVGTGSDLPTLLHSVGLALADNELQIFLEKGINLPAKKTLTLKLAESMRKDQEQDVIRLPLVEGEDHQADRNQLIGYLIVKGSEIKNDLPAGAEVEVTIKIDQSRLVFAQAFIPLLGQEFEARLETGKKALTADDLTEDIITETQRFEEIKILGPVAEGYQMIEWTEEVVTKYGTPADRHRFEMLRDDLDLDLDASDIDPDQLFLKIDRMDDLRLRVLRSLLPD